MVLRVCILVSPLFYRHCKWKGRVFDEQGVDLAARSGRLEGLRTQKQGRIEWQLRLAGLLLEWLEDNSQQEKDKKKKKKKEEYVVLSDARRATRLLPFGQERGVFFSV